MNYRKGWVFVVVVFLWGVITPTLAQTIPPNLTSVTNNLTPNDSLYKPIDGKVNMLDAGYVIKWLH